MVTVDAAPAAWASGNGGGDAVPAVIKDENIAVLQQVAVVARTVLQSPTVDCIAPHIDQVGKGSNRFVALAGSPNYTNMAMIS